MIFLLAIYIIYLIVFAGYSFLGIYHLWRFGYVGDLTKPAIVAYLVISIVLIVMSLALIASRPWPVEFSF